MREIVLALPAGSSGDWLRGLGDYLDYESELRGRVGLTESEPASGTLSGGVVEAVTVGLGSGGAITVLVSAAVSWLRQLAPQAQQPVPTELTLALPDGGSVTVKTAVARAWTQGELGAQIDHLVRQLADATPADAG